MNKPKIRFKGFEGEWKRQSLGDTSASFSGGTPAVSVSDYYGGNIPFIRSGEIHENRTQLYITQAGLNNSSAKIVEKGTILYALYGATSGDVGFSKLRGAINQAILAIEPAKKYIDRIFLVGFLQSYKHRIINELLQGGQGNLSGSLVKKILLAFPSLPEQRALASYFTSLDAQIAASTSRLSSLKQIKAASLLNMFPQKGETVPRVRFKGFQGEWKEKALGDVVDDFKYGINAAAVSYDGDNKYLRITDIDEESRAFIKDELTSPDVDLSSCNEYIMQEGDIVIARTGASVGKSYIYHPIDGKVYFAGFLIRARVNKKVDREFVYLNTLTDGFKKYIRFVSQRSGQPGVNAEELKSYLMNLPASLPEQRAIASFFTALDAQITLHRERLEKLKQIKAACLEKMFA